jgi:hypothetical protein
MKRFGTILLLVTAVTTWKMTEGTQAYAQAGQNSYVGRWASKPEWCRSKPGTSDEIPITFTRRGMKGLENSCEFNRVSGGSGRWLISMTCHGEGMTEKHDVELLVDGNTMVYRERGGRAARLTRCR